MACLSEKGVFGRGRMWAGAESQRCGRSPREEVDCGSYVGSTKDGIHNKRRLGNRHLYENPRDNKSEGLGMPGMY